MEEPPPLILPASAAPGDPLRGEEEKTPAAVQYFRLYCALVALLDLITVIYGIVLMIVPMTASHGMAADVRKALSGGFWAAVAGAHFLACLIALFGGRRPWVQTLGIAVLLSSFLWCCCIPFGILILIQYNDAAVKRYYAGSAVIHPGA